MKSNEIKWKHQSSCHHLIYFSCFSRRLEGPTEQFLLREAATHTETIKFTGKHNKTKQNKFEYSSDGGVWVLVCESSHSCFFPVLWNWGSYRREEKVWVVLFLFSISASLVGTGYVWVLHRRKTCMRVCVCFYNFRKKVYIYICGCVDVHISISFLLVLFYVIDIVKMF